MKFNALVFCFALLCLTSIAAAAESYQQDDVTYVDYECPDGCVISNVYLDDIDPYFNSTIVLDHFGEEYILQINNTKQYFVHWYFTVTLQYPNGTVETQYIDTTNYVASDADIKIQYFTYLGDTDSVFDVDVYVGLLPLTASFTNPVSSESEIGDILSSTGLTYTRLAFSDVQASCTNEFNFEAIYVTKNDFQGQVKESVGEMVSGGTELFFSWAWDSILTFVEMIPGVGPYMATALELSAAIIGEVFFYLDLLFIEYPETTIMTIEFFILAGTLLKTKKNDNIFAMIEIYASLHKSIIEFVFTITVKTISLLIDIIKTIAGIVQSIKPL